MFLQHNINKVVTYFLHGSLSRLDQVSKKWTFGIYSFLWAWNTSR